MKIGDKEYRRVIIVNKNDEVLALIEDGKIVEKSDIRCILED